MLPIFLMYQQVTQNNLKSLVQGQIELFITAFSGFIYHIPCCTGCYTKLLASKSFRKEVKNLFS